MYEAAQNLIGMFSVSSESFASYEGKVNKFCYEENPPVQTNKKNSTNHPNQNFILKCDVQSCPEDGRECECFSSVIIDSLHVWILA